MGSDIFKAILHRKIDVFVNQFNQDSNAIFKKDNSLFHPLEYGVYKEQAFKEILKLILPKNLSLSDGFIITSKNKVSTQCYVIIHKPEIPLIEDSIAKFFPIELVSGIFEIKSNLSKKDFKLALRKMAENKKLVSDKNNYGLDSSRDNNILSVLICNKFDFEYRKIDFEEVYHGIEREYWHNTVLSINDGLFVYKMRFNDLNQIPAEWDSELNFNNVVTWEYPIFDYSPDSYQPPYDFIDADHIKKYFHIEFTLCIISNVIFSCIYENFEITDYLDHTAVIHKL